MKSGRIVAPRAEFGCQTVMSEVAAVTRERDGNKVTLRQFKCKCSCGNIAVLSLNHLARKPPPTHCRRCRVRGKRR